MEQTVKLPRTALTLYAKLYCKRKDSPSSKYSSNLIEATKSWLSLSNKEKQQFHEKYKEYKIKCRELFAHYLKNAEPYMKRKDSKRKNRNGAGTVKARMVVPESQSLEYESQEITSLNSPNLETNMDNGSGSVTQLEPELLHNQQSMSDPHHLPDNALSPTQDCLRTATQMEDDHLLNQQRTHESQEYLGCELPEPAPPSLITSKDLFEMTKAMDEGIDSTWDSLPTAEKRRYQFAVGSIKKEYINKYKAYLESLPSIKLFDHYNKTI